MTCPIEERYETFVLRVIGDLLIDGPSAPFYKNLIESGLGSAFSPVSGYDSYTKDTAFTVGLQGNKLLLVFSAISLLLIRCIKFFVKHNFSGFSVTHFFLCLL